MEEGGGAEEKGRRFSPSALSPFHFHLSPFPPETPDTQASGGLALYSKLRGGHLYVMHKKSASIGSWNEIGPNKIFSLIKPKI